MTDTQLGEQPDDEIDRWKISNNEGLVPPVSYYQSDRVAARAEGRDDRTVTLVGGTVNE